MALVGTNSSLTGEVLAAWSGSCSASKGAWGLPSRKGSCIMRSEWLRNFVIQSSSAPLPCDRHGTSDKLFCCVPNQLFKKKEIFLYWHGTLRLYFLICLEDCPIVFCVEYKTANRTLIFCGMKTNSIYSVEVKYLYIVKARSKWSVQVIEEICTRAGSWHGKVRFSLSFLTIAPLFSWKHSDNICFISVNNRNLQQGITLT